VTSNKYDDKKIVWFPEKLYSLKDNIIKPPIYVRIKPINRCCHKCFFCVYNSDFSNMHETMDKHDILSKDKLFEILDDFKDIGVKAVTYSGGGEPLMHPNILDIVRKTKENNIDLSIITNGQLLKNEIAEEFYDSKWIRISVDYFNDDLFYKSRSVNKNFFLEIVKNIKSFVNNKSINCEITLNYIITKLNYDTIYEACKFFKDLGVNNIRLSPMWTPDFVEYHKDISDTVINSIYKSRIDLQDKNYIIYDSYNITSDVTKRKYHKCYVMQIIPVIGADGIVYNCHNKAYSNDGIIGDINNQTFKQMWFSEETKEYFNTFDPMIHCNHQCANDNKNIIIYDLINVYGDNFV